MDPIHPGEHLAEELAELHMSAAELARQLQVPTNRITQILNGRRSITADTALRLAYCFDTTSQFWLNLQTLYNLCENVLRTALSSKSFPNLDVYTSDKPLPSGKQNCCRTTADPAKINFCPFGGSPLLIALNAAVCNTKGEETQGGTW